MDEKQRLQALEHLSNLEGRINRLMDSHEEALHYCNVDIEVIRKALGEAPVLEDVALDALKEVLKAEPLEYYSISFVQRRMKVGFNRAAEMLNALVKEGYMSQETIHRWVVK